MFVSDTNCCADTWDDVIDLLRETVADDEAQNIPPTPTTNHHGLLFLIVNYILSVALAVAAAAAATTTTAAAPVVVIITAVRRRRTSTSKTTSTHREHPESENPAKAKLSQGVVSFTEKSCRLLVWPWNVLWSYWGWRRLTEHIRLPINVL